MSLARMLDWLRAHVRYNTVKIVSIQNFQLSLIFRLIQVLIILYILVSVIVIKKGYQRFGAVSGSTTIKVKGSAYNAGGIPWLNINTNPQPPAAPTDFTQIFDSTDLVYPAAERDAVFISTNLYMTLNQSRGTCYPGSDDWYNTKVAVGTADADCKAFCVLGTLVNEAATRTGGVWDGNYKLLPDSKDATKMNCYCELWTWCPDENIPPIPGSNEFHLAGVDNWTVSFRQNVRFDAFGVVTTNLQPKDSTTPPIYTIGQMLATAGLTYEGIRRAGAVLVMQTDWQCNLDYSVNTCDPSVSFVSLGSSFNFRRAEYTSSQGLNGARDLIKQYGLRIVIILTGHGSAFDAATFFISIGSGIGLLTVASLVADFIAINLLGQKQLYQKAKFKMVEVTDDGRARGISEETRKNAPGTTTSTSVRSSNDLEMQNGAGGSGNGHSTAEAIIPVGSLASDREESWGKRRGS